MPELRVERLSATSITVHEENSIARARDELATSLQDHSVRRIGRFFRKPHVVSPGAGLAESAAGARFHTHAYAWVFHGAGSCREFFTPGAGRGRVSGQCPSRVLAGLGAELAARGRSCPEELQSFW